MTTIVLIKGSLARKPEAQISWQAQHFVPVPGQVQISWQAQHFRKVKHRFRARRNTFARSSTDFVAGAALSQGQVEVSWQAQHFLSQGQVYSSWQAQHFRKVQYRFRGRRSTFARSGADR